MNRQRFHNAAFYGFLALAVLVFLNRSLQIFSFRYDLAGLEHYFLYLILKSGSGQLYGDPGTWPYLVAQYPPVYLYIVKAAALAGEWLQGDIVRSAYVGGRLFNLALNLATCGLIYRFFRHFTKAPVRQAALPALMVFSVWMAHIYAVRPDSLKLFFLVAMYYSAARYLTDSPRALRTTILFAVLAVITKQDAALHVGLLGLLIWSRRGFVPAAVFTTVSSVVSVFLLWAVCGFSAYNFAQNFIVGISQGMSPDWLRTAVYWNLPAFAAMLLLLVTAWVAVWRENAAGVDMVALLTLLFLLTLSTVFKWGSNFNYFTEFQVLILLWFAWWYVRRPSPARDGIFLLAVLLLVANNYTSRNTRVFDYFTERQAYREYRENRAEAEEIRAAAAMSDKDIIVFSPFMALHLYDLTVLGTTANEYPELFLPGLKDAVGSLPERTYAYGWYCSEEHWRDTWLIVPKDQEELHLRTFADMTLFGDQLVPVEREETDRFRIFSLRCASTSSP